MSVSQQKTGIRTFLLCTAPSKQPKWRWCTSSFSGKIEAGAHPTAGRVGRGWSGAHLTIYKKYRNTKIWDAPSNEVAETAESDEVCCFVATFLEAEGVGFSLSFRSKHLEPLRKCGGRAGRSQRAPGYTLWIRFRILDPAFGCVRTPVGFSTSGAGSTAPNNRGRWGSGQWAHRAN